MRPQLRQKAKRNFLSLRARNLQFCPFSPFTPLATTLSLLETRGKRRAEAEERTRGEQREATSSPPGVEKDGQETRKGETEEDRREKGKEKEKGQRAGGRQPPGDQHTPRPKAEQWILQSALSKFFKTRAVTFRKRGRSGKRRAPRTRRLFSAARRVLRTRGAVTGPGGAGGRETAADSCHNKLAETSSRLKPQQEVG